MLFFSRSIASSRQPTTSNSASNTSSTSLVGSLLKIVNILFDNANTLLNSIPRSMKISGLLATFATPCVQAVCYIDEFNRRYDINSIQTLFHPRNTTQGLHEFLQNTCRMKIATDDSDCLTGNLMSGCYQFPADGIRHLIYKEYGLENAMIWVSTQTPHNSWLNLENDLFYYAYPVSNDKCHWIDNISLAAGGTIAGLFTILTGYCALTAYLHLKNKFSTSNRVYEENLRKEILNRLLESNEEQKTVIDDETPLILKDDKKDYSLSPRLSR